MVDPNAYKQVMRRFATGVMVLTTPTADGMHALTVNAVTSVSLKPLLLLVCIEKSGQSHAHLRASGVFALNILGDGQRQLAEKFAYDREARNDPGSIVQGHAGQVIGAHGRAPLLLNDALGFLECRITAEHPGGDHTIFVGEVLNAGLLETARGPLVYYGGKYLTVEGG